MSNQNKIMGGIFIALGIFRVISGDFLAAGTGLGLGASCFINPKQSETTKWLYYGAMGFALICLAIRLLRWFA
jgi:hypothetical protein